MSEHFEGMRVRVEGSDPIPAAPGERLPEPPFFIVIDRSIPPDEVHFRQDGKTVAVMKLGLGQHVVLPRRVDQTLPVAGSLLAAVKLDDYLTSKSTSGVKL